VINFEREYLYARQPNAGLFIPRATPATRAVDVGPEK